jgi:hypothetical protein
MLRTAKTGCQVRVVGIGLVRVENEMGRAKPDLGRAGPGYWACWASLEQKPNP